MNMNNRIDRIRTTSGLMFKGEKNYLVRNAMRWKLSFDHEIDRERMQKALDAALRVCPYMGMSMTQDENGMWYVPNPSPVVLSDEIPEKLGGEETGKHLFCLVCDGRSLELDVYHGLTDAVGMQWFFEALLTAYYDGEKAAAGSVADAVIRDEATDILDMDPGFPEGGIPEAVMPEHPFTFPQAVDKENTNHTMAVFSRKELQAFCEAHDCSVTAALVTMIATAIQRVHAGNTAPICVRCPVNSRKILDVPDTFMNASIPQVLACVDAAQAADGRTDEMIRDIASQIERQTDPDRAACFCRVIGARIRKEPLENDDRIMDIFHAPVIFSNLGSLNAESAAAHITGSEFFGCFASPVIFSLSTVGNSSYLTINQDFKGTQYLDAVEQVMGENGVGLSQTGRLADVPRFMDRMARIVRRYKDRTAVVDDQRSMTYGELDMESGKIYRYLKRKGVGRESMVQIVMPRCAGYYSCIAGILRAGAAYVPLEENYPEQRIAYIREDSGCVCVLDETLYAQIMEQEEYLAGYEKTDVHDACYAVYTSGSTGNPKGVLHEYGSLDAQALETPEKDEYPELQCGMMTPFYFAAATIFNSDDFLCAGTLHIVRRDVVHNLNRLAAFIEERKIEKIFMTPSYVRMYPKPAASLKTIIVAGEPASKVYYPGGKPAIHNVYGMSETGFLLAGFDFDRAYDIPPIGRPLNPFEDLHLEDENGKRIIGPGEGELCYRNLYFRGYIHLPDKTAHALRDGVFHTNDLARRDENGLYYVIGRLDDMFKINGNRIEPAEIERRVREATGLTQVIARGFTEGAHSFVCAYFLKEEAQRLNIWDGKKLTCSLDSLHEHLPDYMIPAHYVAVDEFPHNANGKLVRSQLPAPRIETGDRPYTAPVGEKEKLLCTLMAKALHLDRTGAEDDFYEIGGDSMGAIVLLGLCEEAGLKIPLSVLYRNRTPRALAKAWEAGQVLEGDMSERAREAVKKPLPILYEMKIHIKQMEERPDGLAYNIPQLLKLKKGVDLSKLSAALDKVFRAHPSLWSTFRKKDGEWCQVFDESLFEPTRVITMSDEEFKQELGHIVRPLHGLEGVPHRRALYHTDSADYMFWDIHHSIADGTAVMLLREQVWSSYADPGYEIPEDLYPWFLEQLGELQRDAQAPENEEAKAYYDGHFETDPGSLVLQPDLTGPEGKEETLTGHREQERTVDGGSSLFLAATAIAAAAMNDKRKALIYSVYHGRDQEAKRWSVGMFATSIPVYVDLTKEQTGEDILNDVREQLNFGTAHCAYPFDYLHPAPLYNTVLFNYQKDTFDLGNLSAIVESRVPLVLGQSGMVVTGLIDRKGIDRLTWYCGYNAGWYSGERIEAFHACFRKAVEWLLTSPSKSTGESGL